MHIHKYSWSLQIAEKILGLGPFIACQKVFSIAENRRKEFVFRAPPMHVKKYYW